MRERLQALLVHGLGNQPDWWDPVLPALVPLGIKPTALAMPALETEGPEAWVKKIVAQARGTPTILIGHSLGAAAGLQAALQCPVAGLVLLACPPFFKDFAPPPPPSTLSPSAMARVARFLQQTTLCAQQVTTEAMHLVGEQDAFIPLQQARRWPFPLVVIPAAGHELNRAAGLLPVLLDHLVTTQFARRLLDPGVRLRHLAVPALQALALTDTAPSPARLDIEITTRCQCACPLCARTLQAASRPTDMAVTFFDQVLAELPHLQEIFFVGLGEPLLHPHLAAFVERAARCAPKVKLVTNGLLASPALLAQLHERGLTEVTFSLDSTDPARFRKLRGGAALETILAHFNSVPAGLNKSIFATLSRYNLEDLPGLIALAKSAGLRALAITDANFAPNQKASLHELSDLAPLTDAIHYARQEQVLLVSQHFHDFDGVPDAYRRCRVRRPADVASRYTQHTHCLAPWRIAVVGATGEVTPCNCAPTQSMGHLHTEAFEKIWNGTALETWRANLRAGRCADCLVCPRY